jgi:peptide/nickel transport system substrate-binding protein
MRKLGAVLLTLAILAGLTISSPVRGQSANTFIVASNISDIITLDPARAYESTNLTIHHATYETLLEIKADDLNTLVPGLAESYTVSDDGLTYTFVLNKAAKFASGNPVTAADVVWSWTRLKNVKGGPSFYYTDSGITSLEAVDDATVKVVLGAEYPAFATVVTAPAMSILDSKLAMEHGATDAEDAETTDTAKEWLDQNSAGSGPFVLTGWSPNSEVTMIRNENYWKTPPALESVTMRESSDSASSLQLLSRGDIDVAQNIDADTAAQAEGNADITKNIGQSLNLMYIAISPDPFFELPISDVKVRQAIAYAIDYDGIIDGLAGGYAARPAAILPIGILGSDGTGRYERDVEKAKALLKEAGFEAGFEITLTIGGGVTAGVPREVLAAKLQADLAEVGITVNIEQMTNTNFLTAFRAKELPLVISSWTPDYLDGTMWSDYFSRPDSGVSARIRMDVPAILEAAQKGGRERDIDARIAAYAEYQKAHVEAAVFIPLMQEQYIDLLRSDVKGYTFHPVYFMDFSTISK